MKKIPRVTAALAPAILVALGAAAPALGFQAPEFRGEPNSVHAIFDWVDQGVPWDVTLFETGENNTYPLDMTPPGASGLLDTTVTLPNFIDPLPIKDIRLCLSFDGTVPLELIEYLVNPTPFSSDVEELGRGQDPTGAPNYFIDIRLRPNPDWEEITIFGNVNANIVPGNLLTIEVDTISFPTPGAISVAAFAGLATVPPTPPLIYNDESLEV